MNKTAEFAAGAAVAVDGLDGSASAAIDASLRGAVEHKDVPGVVALVANRERVLYQGAFGVADVSTGRPLTTDALFRIASMTKPVTSVALMQLVEQGKIGLDDPAEKYLPELKNPMVVESFDAKTGDYKLRPASKPATVRNFSRTPPDWPIPSPVRSGATSSRTPARAIRLADPCCSIPASAGTTAPQLTSSAAWSRWSRGKSSRNISATTFSCR